MPPKAKSTSKVRIPIKNKDSLRDLGYSSKNVPKERHEALNKAVTKYGKTKVVEKLNAVKILTKNRSPGTSRVFGSDLKYVQGKK